MSHRIYRLRKLQKAFYTALLRAVDGVKLLFPVRVRHVENMRRCLPTYTPLQRITSKLLHCQPYVRIS